MRLLLLLLLAGSCLAADDSVKTIPLDEAVQMFRKMEARRAAEYDQYVEILTDQAQKIQELQRKVDTLTGRALCS